MAIVALDCDGVLIDYVGAACEWAGKKKEDATAWDFFSAWGMPGLWKAWDRVVAEKWFCYRLSVLPCAFEFVDRLRERGYRVIFATSPHKNAPLWPGERQLFLEHKFGAGRGDVVHTHDKSLVRADLLIDDKPQNIESFDGPGLLLDQPWNRGSDIGRRVIGYRQSYRAVEEILG